MLGLTGCSGDKQTNKVSTSTPQPVVKQIKEEVKIPKNNDIESIEMLSDSASQNIMFPNKLNTTKEQVVQRLKAAEPVSVKFPKVNKKSNLSSSGYSGPATLYLKLAHKEIIKISPAHYFWEKYPYIHQWGYSYINDIIEYQDGNKTAFFKSSSLYDWLKNDEWKSQFKRQGS